jgi:hypothetical protein
VILLIPSIKLTNSQVDPFCRDVVLLTSKDEWFWAATLLDTGAAANLISRDTQIILGTEPKPCQLTFRTTQGDFQVSESITVRWMWGYGSSGENHIYTDTFYVVDTKLYDILVGGRCICKYRFLVTGSH